jgi:hypothetical protein
MHVGEGDDTYASQTAGTHELPLSALPAIEEYSLSATYQQ